MNSVYIYPNFKTDISLEILSNTYILELKESLKKYTIVVDCKFNYPFIDLLLNGHNSNVIIINWAESISVGPFGVVKYFLLIIYLFISRLLSKKIIGIVHNKYPHNGTFFKFQLMLIYMFFTHSIVHSLNGKKFLSEELRQKNIFYFPHPYKKVNICLSSLIKFDYLIWGRISAYKGIIEFLEWRLRRNCSDKILIVGEDSDGLIKSLSLDFLKNVELDLRFVCERELIYYHEISDKILFTHNSGSVFSSGSLIYSLGTNKKIVAPKIGAFLDYGGHPNVFLYSKFDELPNLVSPKNDNFDASNLIRSWDDFAKFLNKML